MKSLVLLIVLLFSLILTAFSQDVFIEINKNSRDLYNLYVKIDTVFNKLTLDIVNSYASLVDQDSIDLGTYEIFHFDKNGHIMAQFKEKNSNEVKFVRLNLIFKDSIGNTIKHNSYYHELYVKEKEFLLDETNLLKKELKIYFNDNTLARAIIWTRDGKLVKILDIYSGVPENIDFLIPGMYFLSLVNFTNIERFSIP